MPLSPLLLLARDADPDRFVRGAVRVHARLCAEANLSLEEAQLVLAALDAMRGPGSVSGASALLAVCEEHGLTGEANVLRDWLGASGPRVRAKLKLGGERFDKATNHGNWRQWLAEVRVGS